MTYLSYVSGVLAPNERIEVYFDPPDLGWEPYFKSWVEKFIPTNRQQDATCFSMQPLATSRHLIIDPRKIEQVLRSLPIPSDPKSKKIIYEQIMLDIKVLLSSITTILYYTVYCTYSIVSKMIYRIACLR